RIHGAERPRSSADGANGDCSSPAQEYRYARLHGIQLEGELAPCSGCSMAKGIRASTPHHTTSRAAAPLDMVHIDTADRSRNH
ncbi:unnamed protein product, partial [Ascophyllum nodosum]